MGNVDKRFMELLEQKKNEQEQAEQEEKENLFDPDELLHENMHTLLGFLVRRLDEDGLRNEITNSLDFIYHTLLLKADTYGKAVVLSTFLLLAVMDEPELREAYDGVAELKKNSK